MEMSEDPSHGIVNASSNEGVPEILPGHGGPGMSQTSMDAKLTYGNLYSTNEETTAEYDKLRLLFIILLAVAGFFGFLAVCLLIGYHIDKAGGKRAAVYTWDSSSSLHQIIMMLFGVILQGIGILVYRISPFTSDHNMVKLIHVGVNALVGLAMAVGLLSIYCLKESKRDKHFLTQHGWAGIIAIPCFLAQHVGGAIFFLVPIWPIQIRNAVVPFHRAVGWLIYLVSCITALMAFNNASFANVSNKKPEHDKLNEQELFARFAFLFLLFHVTITLYLAIAPQFKRRPRPM